MCSSHSGHIALPRDPPGPLTPFTHILVCRTTNTSSCSQPAPHHLAHDSHPPHLARDSHPLHLTFSQHAPNRILICFTIFNTTTSWPVSQPTPTTQPKPTTQPALFHISFRSLTPHITAWAGNIATNLTLSHTTTHLHISHPHTVPFLNVSLLHFFLSHHTPNPL